MNSITAASITSQAPAQITRSKGIPDWTTAGDLPPGIHRATWQEVEKRFAWNPHRRRLLKGFGLACALLRKAGCQAVFLGGSFVTTKAVPADFDAVWDDYGVELDKMDPVFWDVLRPRAKQKHRFCGELLPARLQEAGTLLPMIELLQRTRDGHGRKGIIGIQL